MSDVLVLHCVDISTLDAKSFSSDLHWKIELNAFVRVMLRRMGSVNKEEAEDEDPPPSSHSSPEPLRRSFSQPFSLLLKREEMLLDIEFPRANVMLLDIDVRR